VHAVAPVAQVGEPRSVAVARRSGLRARGDAVGEPQIGTVDDAGAEPAPPIAAARSAPKRRASHRLRLTERIGKYTGSARCVHRDGRAAERWRGFGEYADRAQGLASRLAVTPPLAGTQQCRQTRSKIVYLAL